MAGGALYIAVPAAVAVAVTGPAVAATGSVVARTGSAAATPGPAGVATGHTPTAATPTVKSTAQCYENVDSTLATTYFVGTGWNPGDTVKLTNQAYGIALTETAGSTGYFIAQDKAPGIDFKQPGDREITLTATDTKTGQTATVNFYVTALMASTRPVKALPSKKVKWMFSGFLPGKQIYGHFLYNGKTASLADYGRAGGPCGTLTTNKRMFPGGNPQHTEYGFQIDDAKRYSTSSAPRITSTFQVFGQSWPTPHFVEMDAR